MLFAFLKELLKTKMYKPSQGKVARRLTFLGLVLIFAAGAYATYVQKLYLSFGGTTVSAMIAMVTLLAGAWFAYRIINFPSFADFLISVEAEMTKVSWPTQVELISTSKVVLLFMFMFIALVFFFDVTFNSILSLVNMMMGKS